MAGDRVHERPGALAGWRRDGRTVFADFGGPVVSVSILTERDVRVRLAPTGTFAPRRSWAVARPDEAFAPVDFDVDASHGSIAIRTGGLVIELGAGGRVDVHDADGRPVLVDDPGGGPSWSHGEAVWTKAMPDGTGYFGFGERTGLLDKRGRRYTCWTTDEWRQQGPTTDELYIAVPFFLALGADGRSHGIFLNSTYRSVFDLTRVEERRMRIAVEGGELDLYLHAGPEPARVVEAFTALVGRPRLPPRWALGFHQSRWGYRSAGDVLEVAGEYRRRRIPLDAVHLDIDHMDRCRVFTWDPECFPDPAGLTAALHEQGVRAVVVVSAGVKHQPEGGYRVYDEGRARDAFVRAPRGDELTGWIWPGRAVFPDHFREDVREWWGSLYRLYLDAGIDGFLNDMNEPAMHDLPVDHPDSDNTEPQPDTRFGPPEERVTHEEARNAYALVEAAGTIAGLQHARPDERPFLLSRSGFAGLQRHAGVWTGDIASTWEHLEMTLPQLLNLGVSGMPFVGADVGGFFESCGPELLIRWTQLGAFYPFARNHSAKETARQEPWVWGDDVEAACRRALELRSRLLPYLYTVFEEATRTGLPMLRPLFLHYPDDHAARIADQALLGRDLLVAPVLRPAKASREVYLPAGVWFDLRSGERYAGPAAILADAPLHELPPVFARGGAVLPLGPPAQSTQEPLDPLELRVFPDGGGHAAGRLYEDDGETMAYTRGESCTTEYVLEDGTLRAERRGSFQPGPRTVVVGERRFADAVSWEVQVA